MEMKINMDPPIQCCDTDTLLSFDTIIHYVLLYFKCLRYRILCSSCSDSQLQVGLNTRCKINQNFNDGDISQHQKNKFYNSVRAFHERAFKYTLDNLTHSHELLKHAEVINWEHRKDVTINSITYFAQSLLCVISWFNLKDILNLNFLNSDSLTLREECPNTGLFLVRIFLYSVQIQENADQK